MPAVTLAYEVILGGLLDVESDLSEYAGDAPHVPGEVVAALEASDVPVDEQVYRV